MEKLSKYEATKEFMERLVSEYGLDKRLIENDFTSSRIKSCIDNAYEESTGRINLSPRACVDEKGGFCSSTISGSYKDGTKTDMSISIDKDEMIRINETSTTQKETIDGEGNHHYNQMRTERNSTFTKDGVEMEYEYRPMGTFGKSSWSDVENFRVTYGLNNPNTSYGAPTEKFTRQSNLVTVYCTREFPGNMGQRNSSGVLLRIDTQHPEQLRGMENILGIDYNKTLSEESHSYFDLPKDKIEQDSLVTRLRESIKQDRDNPLAKTIIEQEERKRDAKVDMKAYGYIYENGHQYSQQAYTDIQNVQDRARNDEEQQK